MLRRFLHPLSGYVLGFVVSYGLYALKYSEIYPELSCSLNNFIIVSVVAASFLWLYLLINNSHNMLDLTPDWQFARLGFWLIISANIVQILVMGYVPLINSLWGEDSGYENYGIKYFKVALSAFMSFYLIYGFHMLLSDCSKQFRSYIFKRLLAVCIVPVILMNRGFICINAVACFYIYVKKYGVKKWVMCLLSLVFFVALYLFGVLGNIRSKAVGGVDHIVNVISPADKFVQTGLSETFLWPYVYMTCSLANLQSLTENLDKDNYSVYKFISANFFPQTISKLLYSDPEGKSHLEDCRVNINLTTFTMFREAALYGGISGLYVYFFSILLLVCWFEKLFPSDSRFCGVVSGNLFAVLSFAPFSNVLVLPSHFFVFLIAYYFQRKGHYA